MNWTMVVMLCLTATPREQCDEHTAVWVTKPIYRYNTQAGCATAAVQTLPQVQSETKDTYAVLKCRWSKPQ